MTGPRNIPARGARPPGPLVPYMLDARAFTVVHLKRYNTIDVRNLDNLRACARHSITRWGSTTQLTVDGGAPCLRAYVFRALQHDGIIAAQGARVGDLPSRFWPCFRPGCLTCWSLPRGPLTPGADLPAGQKLVRRRKARKRARATHCRAPRSGPGPVDWRSG